MLFPVWQTMKCISVIVAIIFSSVAYGHQTPGSCLPKSDHEGFSIFKVVEKGCTNITFTVLLLYKN